MSRQIHQTRASCKPSLESEISSKTQANTRPVQATARERSRVMLDVLGAPCLTSFVGLVRPLRTTPRRNNMEYAIGIAAATAVGLFATVVGFDKERSFYPVVLIVIATLYLLFAVMAKSTGSLVAEAIPALVFVAMAVLGFRKKTPWLVVAGLVLHGIFDFFHHALIANSGVPVWWPGWCLSYDVVAAAYMAGLILIRRTSRAGES